MTKSGKSILGYLPVYPWIHCKVSLDAWRSNLTGFFPWFRSASPFYINWNWYQSNESHTELVDTRTRIVLLLLTFQPLMARRTIPLGRTGCKQLGGSNLAASPHHARLEHRASRKESPDALARASGQFGLVRKRGPQENSRVRHARELPLSSCR